MEDARSCLTLMNPNPGGSGDWPLKPIMPPSAQLAGCLGRLFCPDASRLRVRHQPAEPPALIHRDPSRHWRGSLKTASPAAAAPAADRAKAALATAGRQVQNGVALCIRLQR